ncbi:MAG: type II toxin-antitoxin system VapC family toxin [Acidobacteriota bacterium]|nr:type II toxin-antitoxin system VapC family toxin [Acidobacteriota bacterium]
MSAFYLESSALVKRYSTEKGSKFIIKLMQPSAGNRLYAVKITEVEICAALTRKRKGLTMTAVGATKSISRFRRNFAARFVKSDASDSILNEAIRLTDLYTLRGYDAVQLAAALEANTERVSRGLSPLVFVSADAELNIAAQSEGLAVENPNNYP